MARSKDSTWQNNTVQPLENGRAGEQTSIVGEYSARLYISWGQGVPCLFSLAYGVLSQLFFRNRRASVSSINFPCVFFSIVSCAFFLLSFGHDTHKSFQRTNRTRGTTQSSAPEEITMPTLLQLFFTNRKTFPSVVTIEGIWEQLECLTPFVQSLSPYPQRVRGASAPPPTAHLLEQPGARRPRPSAGVPSQGLTQRTKQP